MANRLRGVQAGPHPLDPLSADEIAAAAAVVRSARDLGAGGHNHIVQPEDLPVRPIVHCGFIPQPFAFFDRNPTLDVPPAKPAYGRCA